MIHEDEWSTWERRVRAEEQAAGAERERLRIRRALMRQLMGFVGPAWKLDILEMIDAATRKGAGRKKASRG